jgi:hypothetical protein
MEKVAEVRKALVPLVVALVLLLIGWTGVTPNMTVAEAITLVVTAGFVWLIPNKS